MTAKKYHFIAGMPRSGSTLLCNVLAQNPRFHTTATSGIMDVIFGIRNSWNTHVEFQAAPNEPAKLRVMKSVLDAFYADVDKPVVFDKCRGWLAYLEMAEELIGEKAKVLVPVRDVRDVLASFEKLWRENSKTNQSKQESQFYFDFQNVKGRTDVWMRPDQPVGISLNRIADALHRGFRDRMFFVDFDQFTKAPIETLKEIYTFLEEPWFEHDVENVKQVTWEDDSVHGMKDLHSIRSSIKPMEPQWPKVLGDFAANYDKFNLWKKL